jgi:hypothetical protein
VQDFIPSPGTLSTAMFYSGYNPLTMKKVHVVNDMREKAMQRALLQYGKPQNRDLVEEALILCGRKDLIGSGPKCLIKKTITVKTSHALSPKKVKTRHALSQQKGKTGHALSQQRRR